MMRLIVTAIISVILLDVVKQLKTEYTPVLSLCIGVVMIGMLLPEAKKLYISLTDIVSYTKLPDKLFRDILNICISGCLCKIICSYCDDFGYRTISSKIDFGCRIYVSGITISWIYELIVNINKLL